MVKLQPDVDAANYMSAQVSPIRLDRNTDVKQPGSHAKDQGHKRERSTLTGSTLLGGFKLSAGFIAKTSPHLLVLLQTWDTVCSKIL